MTQYELTPEQINWFADRIDESPTGVLLVNSYSVKKFRKITGNYTDSNNSIRSNIIRITNGGIGVSDRYLR